MLLFFDKTAVLAPPEWHERVTHGHKETFLPLLDSGDFFFLDPSLLIDEEIGKNMLDLIYEAVTADTRQFWEALSPDSELYQTWLHEGRWDRPPRSSAIQNVLTRRGGDVAAKRNIGLLFASYRSLSKLLLDEAADLGLATKRQADNTVIFHPVLWAVYQARLAMSVRQNALRAGLVLYPSTDDPERISRLLENRGDVTDSAASIVSFDIRQVALNVSNWPLDEILDLRFRHGHEYRRYAACLREFSRELDTLDGDERARAYMERSEQLKDAASELSRYSSRSWLQPTTSVGLGLAGAAYYGTQNDWPAALFSLTQGVVGASLGSAPSSSFTYLFKIQENLNIGPN